MKSKVNKTVFLILLIVVAAALSVSTLSYWAEAVAGATNSSRPTGNISIGKGLNADTVMTVGGGTGDLKKLVPVDMLEFSDDKANSTESKTMTFSVSWTSENLNAAKGAVGNLTASFGDVKIGETTLRPGLIVANLKETYTITADADAMDVEIIVTMTEPLDKAEYDLVKNGTFVIPVTFTVTPQA